MASKTFNIIVLDKYSCITNQKMLGLKWKTKQRNSRKEHMNIREQEIIENFLIFYLV